MKDEESKFCKNYGDVDVPWTCLKTPDERYTMDFTDVEPGAYIHWCSACGPNAHELNAAINKAFSERPGFEEEFAAAVAQAEAKSKENSN